MIQEFIKQIWSLVGVVTLLRTIVPPQLGEIVSRYVIRLLDLSKVYYHLNIPEFKDKKGIHSSKLFADADVYVEALDSASRARALTAYRPRTSSLVGINADYGQIIEDSFHGVTVLWTQYSFTEDTVLVEEGQPVNVERRSYMIRVNKVDKHFVDAYCRHISITAAQLRERSRDLCLFTNNGNASYTSAWISVPFKHPSTFDTLALDPELKDTIFADLKQFKEGKEFYRRIGRAWKRGYLLYGPPGTGKSSLIAAIANHMKYNVYDLELTNVGNNRELRALLTQTKEKSIIIIEDIDCSLNLSDRAKAAGGEEKKLAAQSNVTLSGLLNFTDGLWSCCGEERIIIFTTNHKENLDPALVRCGRMDLHILLSFCSFSAFKVLVKNYLRVDDHAFYPGIEEKIAAGAEMTPAEIIEILLGKVDDPREALAAVDSALDARLREKTARLSMQFAQTEDDAQKPVEQKFLAQHETCDEGSCQIGVQA